MLDLRFIRENPDTVRQVLEKRLDSAPLEEILKLDKKRRQKIRQLDDLRQARKEVSHQREKGQEEGRDLRTMIRGLEEETRQLDEQLRQAMIGCMRHLLGLRCIPTTPAVGPPPSMLTDEQWRRIESLSMDELRVLVERAQEFIKEKEREALLAGVAES